VFWYDRATRYAAHVDNVVQRPDTLHVAVRAVQLADPAW
jgi:hypothetical protein